MPANLVINLDKNRSSSSRNFFSCAQIFKEGEKKRYYKINEQLDILETHDEGS